MKILVLGVGNILLTDEGIGIHAVNALLQDYSIPDGVEVVDGGTSGMELLTFIAQAAHYFSTPSGHIGCASGCPLNK